MYKKGNGINGFILIVAVILSLLTITVAIMYFHQRIMFAEIKTEMNNKKHLDFLFFRAGGVEELHDKYVSLVKSGEFQMTSIIAWGRGSDLLPQAGKLKIIEEGRRFAGSWLYSHDGEKYFLVTKEGVDLFRLTGLKDYKGEQKYKIILFADRDVFIEGANDYFKGQGLSYGQVEDISKKFWKQMSRFQ